MLRRVAQACPDKTAFRLLGDGETETDSTSFGELERSARSLAVRLAERCTPGGRALLLFPTGLDFVRAFHGALFAGLVPVPCFPPTPGRPRTRQRLERIIEDARPEVVMAPTALAETLGDNEPNPLARLDLVDPAQTEPRDSVVWRPLPRGSNELAFLQYTSGSTGAPKGVEITHANLLVHAAAVMEALDWTRDTRAVSWLPLAHDMGLIGMVLQTVYAGSSCVMMPPEAFVQRPVRWLRALTEFGGTLSGGPNFGYELCVRKVEEGEREELRLGAWSVAFNGSEPVRADTLDRFAEAFAPCGFRRQAFMPCYGLAEATLMVTASVGRAAPTLEVNPSALEHDEVVPVEPGAGRRLVSCGPCRGDVGVAIVDPETAERCAPDRVGEIWVSGPTVAAAYWEKHDESEETFGVAIRGERGDAAYLRTGDLGFMDPTGELYVTGRRKDLIIVRGLNRYPQDLELSVERSNPQIRPGCVAAFAVEVQGEEAVAVAAELRDEPDTDRAETLCRHIRRAVAVEHDVEVSAIALVPPGSLDKTTSGKLMRQAARRRFLDGSFTPWFLSRNAPDRVSRSQPDSTREPARRAPGAQEIARWLIARLAVLLGVPEEAIDPRAPFVDHGLDSARAVELAGELERWLGHPVPASAAYEKPSIERLAEWLAGGEAPAPARVEGAPEREAIAVVGLACRFPGAPDAEAFWSLLREGKEGIAEVPPDRWPAEAYYDPNPGTAGMSCTRWGGFLEEIDGFDASFFGISPREASQMDPQQRLLLEVSVDALEHAGIPVGTLEGRRAGVFTGICGSDFGAVQQLDRWNSDAYVATGSALSIAANRLSYYFGSRGPSIAVDTACSSSLVAVHLGCQSLANGECSLALAGGVNLLLAPEVMVHLSKANLMAPDGRCKAFDKDADGYVRGEGVGLVVLKRLSEAVADGDRVRAVILGSAINQDGRTNGLSAPSGEAQRELLADACRAAGVSPGRIGYVETHGTGTAIGDLVEARALGSVIGKERPSEDPCRIGSVKTNVGHLEAAAGVAGLIKTILQLDRGHIVRSLHLQHPNPAIPFESLRLRVAGESEPWSADDRLLAGVSSFGFGGTNAHCVLSEAPSVPESAERPAEVEAAPRILCLSAADPAALDELAEAYRDLLADPNGPELADVAAASALRRDHREHRLAVVARDAREARAVLESASSGRPDRWVRGRASRAPQGSAFVFPGQGSQWLGMGRELFRTESAFREPFRSCSEVVEARLGWSPVDELIDGRSENRWSSVEIVQPLTFALQLGLAGLWRARGIRPSAVVGHSMGEVAAAVVAGALTLEDGGRIICERSRLLERLAGRGSMALVALSRPQLEARLPDRPDVFVAAVNGPSSVVVAGLPEAVDELVGSCLAEDVFARQVKVSVASHTPQVDELRSELREALAGIHPRPSHVPFHSTVEGCVLRGVELDADYWIRNLRQPVLLWPVVQNLAKQGHRSFVELSGHPILKPAIEEGFRISSLNASVVPSLRSHESDRDVMAESLAALYVQGHRVDWHSLGLHKGHRVTLPAYPWRRTRFTRPMRSIEAIGSEGGGGAHPWMRVELDSSLEPERRFWQGRASEQELPYVTDHRIEGAAVVPAASIVEAAWHVGRALFGSDPYAVTDLELRRPLLAGEEPGRTVQMAASELGAGLWSLAISSRSRAAEDDASEWTLHATARVRRHPAESETTEVMLERIRERCPRQASSEELYGSLERRGLTYGDRFRRLERIWVQEGEAFGRLTEAAQGVHAPCLVDAAFQVIATCLPEERIRIPAAIARARIRGSLNNARWAWSVLRASDDDPDVIRADARLLDDEGRVVFVAEGLELRPLEGSDPAPAPLIDQCFTRSWALRPELPTPSANSLRERRCLLYGDAQGLGRALSATLGRLGARVERVPAERRELDPDGELDAFGDDAPTDIVYLRACDASHSETRDPESEQQRTCGDALRIVQSWVERTPARPARLLLVTRGAQAPESDATEVEASSLWGFARTVRLEHPELAVTCVDVEGENAEANAGALAAALVAKDVGPEVALRGPARWEPKLERVDLNEPDGPGEGRLACPSESFRLDPGSARTPEGLRLVPAGRREPDAGEVEIRVRAGALNFRDLLKLLAIYPAEGADARALGDECAGTITRVGAEVEDLAPGEEVIALAPASLARYVTTDRRMVWRRPPSLTAESAAGLPVAFATARYALLDLARLQAGERVLVHSATGGVGLAAIAVARQAGAEIHATAGSPEKRRWLSSLGIEHVFDSRSLAFAEGVRAATQGEGVDVVLNSLIGEARREGIGLLRPAGRLLEIGKRDPEGLRRAGFAYLKDNQSFFAVDLSSLAQSHPDRVGALVGEALTEIAEGTLEPLPCRSFDVRDLPDAFSRMRRAEHVGKIVARMDAAAEETAPPLRPDATYLITGGLGGLGLRIANWLAEHGAGRLVLASRSAPSPEVHDALRALEEHGTRVDTYRCDVAEREELEELFHRLDEPDRRLRGVIHAAGVLDDGIVANLDWKRFWGVMRPKVAGGLFLESLTRGRNLDFVLFFSSAAGTLGSPGQANYAAANAFLDSLASRMRGAGTPTLSVAWGPWAEVGQAAAEDRQCHLETLGLASIDPEEGTDLLGPLLRWSGSFVGVLPLRSARRTPATGDGANALRALLGDAPRPTEDPAGLPSLAGMAPDQRLEAVRNRVLEELARTLRLGEGADLDRPLVDLGIDSLMAVELRNRLEGVFGYTIPIVRLLQGDTLSSIAEQIASSLASSEANSETEEPS